MHPNVNHQPRLDAISVDLERGLLASLLADPMQNESAEIRDLAPSDFGLPAAQAIFAAMRAAGDAFGLLGLRRRLQEANALSAEVDRLLVEIDQVGSLAGPVGRYAADLRHLAAKRRIAAAAEEIANMASKPGDPSQIAERAERLLHAATARVAGAARRPFAEPRGYTPMDLHADQDRQLVSLRSAGWGRELDECLGGGLAPGEIVAVGAAKAGAGKTAFLMQLADGLALRNDEICSDPSDRSPLTPVLLLSEMDPKALARRTLARLVEAPAHVFRSGAAARRLLGADRVGHIYEEATRQLAPDGDFARLAAWQRIGRPSIRRAHALMDSLQAHLEEWAEQIREREGAAGRDVWPVVVVDPIQRWQDHELQEVEALNLLAELLDEYADANGWIVLVTSDTNKAAATGSSGDSLASVFRGSYKLAHSADTVLVLDAAQFDGSKATRQVTVRVDKNRWGPTWKEATFNWHPATGSFTPTNTLVIPKEGGR